jgi:hypothetical protein
MNEVQPFNQNPTRRTSRSTQEAPGTGATSLHVALAEVAERFLMASRSPAPDAYGQGKADGLGIAAEQIRSVLAEHPARPRKLTTLEELVGLYPFDVVLFDDSANGGLFQAYVVPDDGTVMDASPEVFHFSTFGGDYVYAKDMPLPVTLLSTKNEASEGGG